MNLFSRNSKYYQWLPAYLEDGLDEARQAQMQARLAADPVLAAEAERLRRTIQQLQEARTREQAPANAAVPTDLWPRLQRRLERASAPRPTRQIGWMAGVGATAVLALAAALWLPMGFSPHRRESAKIVKTNPPVQVAMTPPKAAVGAVARPASAMTAPPAVPRPVQVAQALPPSPALAAPGPSTLPIAPMPVAARKPLAMPLPLKQSPPATVAAKPTPAAAKPTLMASGLEGSQIGDRAVSVNGISPGSPPAAAPAPASLATDGQAIPASPPMAAFKAAVPAETDAGNTPAPTRLPAASGSVSEAKAGATASPLPLPQDTPHVFSMTAPRFENRMRRMGGMKMGAMKAAVPPVSFHALNAEAAPPSGQSLDTWQATLSAAVQPPLWGEDAGAAQANQALTAARQAGQLDILRGRLEAKRAQSPQDITVGRMLAAVYDFGFASDLVLSERRRIAGLAGADGEDWFALALAEEHAGNAPTAKLDYRRALASAVPPNSFHAALARQRE